MTPSRVFLCALLLPCCLLTASAEEESRYAPVPEGLAAVRGSDADEALAAQAMATLEGTRDESAGGDAFLDARALLVLLDDVGLRHVAERLAGGDVAPVLLPHLLHVVASSPHPAADTLLARAAGEPRAGLRIMAADGLGHGRTEAAIPVLDRLARDVVPGVRAAALRALFAIPSAAATTVRRDLPVDARPDFHARRLRWHRLRGPTDPALLPMALETWRSGRTADGRLEAAKLLARGALATPLDVLEEIVRENGTDALGASMQRLARGVVRDGYDAHDMRLAAILAAFGVAWRAEEEQRTRMIDRMIGWVARPASGGSFDPRPLPETILRMILPDLGEAITAPVVERLRRGAFHEQQRGVTLLLEALSPEAAAAALGPLLDPSAEPSVPTDVRVAAAGGLRQLRRVGSESLAHALVRADEEVVIRRDVIRALEGDDAAWALPLLGALTRSSEEYVVRDAVATLEARAEEGARDLLVVHAFSHPAAPESRLEHLVTPADDRAYEILKRALDDPWGPLRRAALRQLWQVRALRGERALALLRAFRVQAKERINQTHELQQVLYAWFALAPVEGIGWMRESWATFEAIEWTDIPIRSLQNVTAPEAVPAVVDFVLERVGATDDVRIWNEATRALEGRRGHRDGEVDAFWRRALGRDDPIDVQSAVVSLDHPGHADLTDVLLPLFAALDRAEPDVYPQADALLEALAHQPHDIVEPTFLDVILDPNAQPALRGRAAVALVDRRSAEARRQLTTWLTSKAATEDAVSIVRIVAYLVGEGGGAETAAACLATLQQILKDADQDASALDPEAPVTFETGWQVGALVRAIAYTGDESALDTVIDLVFDQRAARYARRAVALHGRRLGPVDATASGRRGPGVRSLWRPVDGLYSPLTPAVMQILENLKAAEDDALAASLERRLAALRQTGDLAAFPDLYLDRVLARLRDPGSGDMPQSAEVVEAWGDRVEPVGGAADFAIARSRVERYIREKRFADAVAEQTRVLEILSRRAYDDEGTWSWRRARASLDAWRGAAAARAGDTTAAEAWLRGAVAWSPLDFEVLRSAAVARAHTGLDLDEALRLVERAAVLELRMRDRLTFDTADALALVHLHREEFPSAVDAIEPVLRILDREFGLWGGRYHLRTAQARAAAGDAPGAVEAALKALGLEPSLADAMRTDPWLAPLREAGSLEALIREAERIALLPDLD